MNKISWLCIYATKPYQIDQPFRLNKKITRKVLKEFFYCLENNISLAKDRPVLTFKVSCEKDLNDYHKFIDCIDKIYSEGTSYLEWEQPDSNILNDLKEGKIKIIKYVIRNNKIPKDNNFIQKMLLQSIFYKVKEHQERPKKIAQGST